MPATALKPVNVARRVIHLQESLDELTSLAHRFPQLKPLQRQMTQVIETMVQSLAPPAAPATVRTRLVEQGAPLETRDQQTVGDLVAKKDYADPTQQAIDILLDMARTFRETAVERMESTRRLGDASLAGPLMDMFSGIRRGIEQWLLSPENGIENGAFAAEEFRALADGLDGAFREPLGFGAADQVQAALDDLISMLERAAGRSGSSFDSEISESVFSRWAKVPPTDETIRRFFSRYHF